MPEENEMFNDLEFENEMEKMADDQLALTKFAVRQGYATNKVVAGYGKRIKKLEGQNKRTMGLIGAAGAVLATAIAAFLDYFVRRPP